jgi:hypothetical protein
MRRGLHKLIMDKWCTHPEIPHTLRKREKKSTFYELVFGGWEARSSHGIFYNIGFSLVWDPTKPHTQRFYGNKKLGI